MGLDIVSFVSEGVVRASLLFDPETKSMGRKPFGLITEPSENTAISNNSRFNSLLEFDSYAVERRA